MADYPLNNSWPSFSKFWMKRWSFKRGSEYKPCALSNRTISATSSSSSLSPSSIAEDVFFSGTPNDKNFECSGQDSSVEDLLDLNSSLRDSEYFRDLHAGPGVDLSPSENQLSILITPVSESQDTPPLFTHPVPSCDLYHPQRSEMVSQSHGNIDLLADQADTVAVDPAVCADEPGLKLEGDPSMESFPILVRSMSTSRRHSWDVPLSPIDLGRRFSLDTASVDSDVDREDPSRLQCSHLPSSSPFQRSVEELDTSGAAGRAQTTQPCAYGRTVYSRSDILATDEKTRAERVSRILETSKQAARASGEENDPEEGLSSTEGQCHMLMVQKVLQELKLYHGANRRPSNTDRKESSGSVTWYEFLSIENEEEEERAERAEKGTRVKRTLSSLRNRMTGSFNKDKGKNRERDQQKERERELKGLEKSHRRSAIGRTSNGHLLVPGSFSSLATCSLCGKTLQRKHGLQCVNCAVNVHKNCKNLLSECNSSKSKTKDFAQKPVAQFYIQATREPWPAPSPPAADGYGRSASGMTVPPRGPGAQPATTTSSNQPLHHTSSSSSIAGEMDDVDGFRLKRGTEDTASLAVPAESSIVEDAYYVCVRTELDAMAQDLEGESWSRAVDQPFLKKHSKELIKRQDVIYELMQTEMHHVRTLKIMLRVYVRELRETLQLDERRLDCLFPRLDSLLNLHTNFLSRLRERRRQSLQDDSEHNYVILRVADILTEQFSGELGERMKESYGAFCSRHTEAVSYYKEQQQNNKKFQNLMRKISNLAIVRRLGVPECILLVTQRITKYPVLVERILQHTPAGTEEHEGVARALALIRDTIVQVDAQVNLHKKETRLREIASKTEPKSLGKIKDGRVFRREDLGPGRRELLHEGTVSWKAASGRLKEILAVLLTDVLVLLQEKDQRYVFSAVDGKPSVISLQKLIVREVAHEEKAMFLICASSNEPEMYEIHTSSKEERVTWITHIRQAVESCPHTEERLYSEEEGERSLRIRDFQERLMAKDAVITQALTEKLQVFAELAESVASLEDATSRSRLLLRGDASDLQQGELLLKGAITDVEYLQNLLASGVRGLSPHPEEHKDPGATSAALPRRAGTFGGYDRTPGPLHKNGSGKKQSNGANRSRERSQRPSSDPQLKEVCIGQGAEEEDDSCFTWNTIWSNSGFPEAEFYDRVLMLAQRLYSLQAIISQQDSQLALRRSLLSSAELDRSGGRARAGDTLLEQEKQRNLEKQREELAQVQRLQARQRQEQARWERERDRHLRQAEAQQERLREREEACRRLEARLAEERQEVEGQRRTYQQDLERLREAARAVERERDSLELQRRRMRRSGVTEGAGVTAHDVAQLQLSSSFNGEPAAGVEDPGPQPRSLVRSSLSVSAADHPERGETLPRREGAVVAKTDVPIHLISTTNQLHKQGGVQQQIPKKLATDKGKAKGRAKGSQRTDSLASVDMKQMLPLKLSPREPDGSLKGRRSISPQQQTLPQAADAPSLTDDYPTELPLPSCPTELPQSSQTSSLQKGQTQSPTSLYPADDSTKEHVIFF
ncbi:rho guanine nucleotide exchange factor 18 isoform X2 [Brachyhypopomus gauderio]|uniref:rho guanine nucleotide exchange factor 18 isoform X2 n=1 Tax=Brachyhypopomus gauderio TaxID=698409 RepID=UPI0040423C14